MARDVWGWNRRHILTLGAALVALPRLAMAQEQIFVISRKRVSNEVLAAQQLRQAENEMSAILQAQIEQAQEALSAEEDELARSRANMKEDEFERRAANFDRRVRETRRVAKERGAELQNGFNEARATIINTIPELLTQVRAEAGARIILDADQVILFDPALDLTDRLIEVFNQAMPVAPVPAIDLSEPVLAPETPVQDEEPTSDQ